MEQKDEYNKPEGLSKEAKEFSEVKKDLEYFSDIINKKRYESSVKKRKKEKTDKDPASKMLQMLRTLQILQMIAILQKKSNE